MKEQLEVQQDQIEEKPRQIIAKTPYKNGMYKTTEALLALGVTSQDERTCLLTAAGLLIYPQQKKAIQADMQLDQRALKRQLELVTANPLLQKTLLVTLSALNKTGFIEIDPESQLAQSIGKLKIKDNDPEKKPSKVEKEEGPIPTELPSRSAEPIQTPLINVLEVDVIEEEESDPVPSVEYSIKLEKIKGRSKQNIITLLKEHLKKYPEIPIVIANIAKHAGITRQRVHQLITDEEKFKPELEKENIELYKEDGSSHWSVRKREQITS